MRSMLVGVTVAALCGSLVSCSSSSGGKPAASPTSETSQASTSAATSATTATSTPKDTDESAKFVALLNVIVGGLNDPAEAGKTIHVNKSGDAAADGQFAVTEDAAGTTVCLTDTSSSVSIQLTKANKEKFDFFSGAECSEHIGSISEGDDGKAKPSSDDPTLQGLAKRIDKLGS